MFKPGKAVRPEDILKHLDDTGLSKFDMPEYFLQVDDVPLTASGKVRKRDIVNWISEGRAAPRSIRWRAQDR
jgi:acyl-CoA synthetase